MTRRLLLLADVVLVLVAAFLGVRLYQTWAARAPATPPEPPPSVTAEAPAPATAAQPRPPLPAYAVVAERNLFSPTRTETPPEPARPPNAAAAAPPAPKPRLFGVVLLPEGRGRAYLEDVQRRRVFGYAVGDLVGDARLEQIKSDRVVMRRGSETFEVLLYDPSKPRQAAPAPGVQSQEAGGAGRPRASRQGVPVPAPGPGAAPVPAPVPGLRTPARPRVVPPGITQPGGAPPGITQPGAESEEQPTEEE